VSAGGAAVTSTPTPALVTYAASGPVIAMVWEGMNVVASGRRMLGAGLDALLLTFPE